MPKHPDMPQTFRPPLTLGGGADRPLTLIYTATFSDGSFRPSLDISGIGPLQFGHSELNNPEPTFTLNGDLVLSVFLPSAIVLGTTPRIPTPPSVTTLSAVTAGVFATPLPFDTQLPFALQGTYVAPSGPLDRTWAVGILARTGDDDDLSTNTKVVATLQFKLLSTGPGARLNVPLGAANHMAKNLDAVPYAEIIGADPFGGDPLSPRPFTLTLWIDRNSGTGTANLTVEGYTLSTSFPLKDFLANSGPAITAVGTVIANASAIDQTVSVHVQNFQIYATV